MGLLDDAIREHLDLKRRRGADPAEVARLEQEALGPVRREPAPADGAPAEAPPADRAPQEDAAADARDERPHDHAPEPHRAERPHPVEPHEHPDDAAHALAPEERHDPPHGDPLLEHREDPVLQPTTEYRVEDHHDEDDAPRDAAADEDVLEETPEFLQETPEHDRLWFEQRPPRDFDFDG